MFSQPTYKQQGNVGLFDSDETIIRLNKMGKPLAKLQEAIDFEMFRDTLEKGLFEQLFNKFYAFLDENNLILHEGTMIDGSFVEVPRQRNTREENKQIKEGRGGEKHYGYKNHAKVDNGSKFIKKGVTTSASEHDSKPVKELVDENDKGEDLLADSAYIGKGVRRVMRKFGMKDKVIKRNTRGKKISKWQSPLINRKIPSSRYDTHHHI